MEKRMIVTGIICVVVILCACVVSFIPSIFYAYSVEIPKDTDLPLNNSSPFKMNLSFPCNPPLIFTNQSVICKPPCDWLPYSEREQLAIVIADWFTAVFSITCFGIVLVTWIKLPELMKFPHFIILIMAGSQPFIVLLVNIPKFGKTTKFYCNSPFLDKTPSTYCEVQGFLIHYTSLVIGEMFVLYNAVLMKRLVIDKIPTETQNNRILVAIFLALFILPLLAPFYVLKYGGNYLAVNLRHCFPKDATVAYYSTLLPQQIFFCVGTTFLLLVIFKIIKERKSALIASPSQAKRREVQLQKIAIQFIMVIISYVICSYLTYGVICITLHNRKAYRIFLERYFGCLMFMKDCPKDFRRYNVSCAVFVLFILSGNVFQCGTFILLAGKKTARQLWKSWWCNVVDVFRPAVGNASSPKTSSVQELQQSSMEQNESIQ
ncbi:uncharacterized protein LOC124441359 [Xenia sp. Carnegie-2017]|uniref:uncharacterized protein LOC124441359 n=1 Tax=Xenia sp. Carnegie-2017 TaxID=2897299 RepID=UPI001F0487F7|nr:uncharacterized protein LOC124441359 [Xenia sp. Carnegie-2017]